MSGKKKVTRKKTGRVKTKTNMTTVDLRTKKGTILKVKATRTSPVVSKKSKSSRSTNSSVKKGRKGK